MSKETTHWLNHYTLQSARAWHTSDQLQKIANTIYDGPIPVDDVKSRLFNWLPAVGSMDSSYTVITPDGVANYTLNDPTRKTIIRPYGALGDWDEGAILGVFKDGYKPHPYAEWLVDNVSHILDDSLAIYSAGLLRGGAQAWVQVSVPEAITTPEGVSFLPNLLAVTSFDGSLATTYKLTARNTVCDNTMYVALGSAGRVYRVKHSRNSDLKLMEAREALAIVHDATDAFSAQVAELTAVTVTDADWSKFLDEIASLKTDKGDDKAGRAMTIASNKRDALNNLWHYDTRVAPWKNTAWGAVQAVNTYSHHFQTVRGAERDERNMSYAVTGEWDKLDLDTLDTLQGVLA